jgi:hypothetical protein
MKSINQSCLGISVVKFFMNQTVLNEMKIIKGKRI